MLNRFRVQRYRKYNDLKIKIYINKMHPIKIECKITAFQRIEQGISRKFPRSSGML